MDKPERKFYLVNSGLLARALTTISKIKPTKEKPYLIKVTLDSEDRTEKQNKLAFYWYKVYGTFTGNGALHERYFAKLTYGIPILMANDGFSSFYSKTIALLPYEDKLKAMEFVPVTSLMTTKQFSEYLYIYESACNERGFICPRPKDIYYEALMIANDSMKGK